MIQYKDNSVLRGMLCRSWHPILINMLEWLLNRYPDKILITCAYEDRDYPSTHSVEPLRAFDLRSWMFEDPEALAEEINRHWIYDYDRMEKKVALYHDSGRGPHLHIQVHENTMKNGCI